MLINHADKLLWNNTMVLYGKNLDLPILKNTGTQTQKKHFSAYIMQNRIDISNQHHSRLWSLCFHTSHKLHKTASGATETHSQNYREGYEAIKQPIPMTEDVVRKNSLVTLTDTLNDNSNWPPISPL